MRRLLFPHLAWWAFVIVGMRLLLTPAEVCPPITAADVRESIVLAADWAERGLQEDGRFLYGYRSDIDEISSDYNIVRHAGVVNSLYQIAVTGEDSYLPAADVGLEYMLDHLVEQGDWIAFAPEGELFRIGANSLMIAALANRRIATGDESYDDLMRGLSRFLVAQQEPSGAVLGFWSPATGEPVPDTYARFGSGEAFWALTLMHRLFPDEGWDEPARRLGTYLATERDRAEGFLLPEADHWGTYGLAELMNPGLDETQRQWARDLAGYFGVETRVESQKRGAGFNYLVRGEPTSGAGTGVIGEGLASLWRLSQTDPELADLEEPLAERLECLAGILVDRQITERDIEPPAQARHAVGAWFQNDYTQMDDQQHAISALLVALRMLEESETGQT